MRLLITAAAMLVATAANGQVPADGAPAQNAEAFAKLQAADTNKDDKWDKPEWLAAGRREMGFNFIDADKDGFVTKAELKAGMERMKAMRAN